MSITDHQEGAKARKPMRDNRGGGCRNQYIKLATLVNPLSPRQSQLLLIQVFLICLWYGVFLVSLLLDSGRG
jgi:GT2 family glycosyltransferase